MMKTEDILVLMRTTLQMLQRLTAIAQKDPEVWENIKSDYNKTMEDFINAPNK